MNNENDLLTRITKLESAQRRSKWLPGLAILLLGALSITTILRAADRRNQKKQNHQAYQSNQGTVRVRELILTNQDGEVVAHLSANLRGTCLELTGRRKVSMASLCVDNDYGSNLKLSNQNLGSNVDLTAGQLIYEGGIHRVPGLSIEEGFHKNGIWINVASESNLKIGHGSRDENSLYMTAGKDSPAIRLVGPSGEQIWKAPEKP